MKHVATFIAEKRIPDICDHPKLVKREIDRDRETEQGEEDEDGTPRWLGRIMRPAGWPGIVAHCRLPFISTTTSSFPLTCSTSTETWPSRLRSKLRSAEPLPTLRRRSSRCRMNSGSTGSMTRR